MYASVNDTVPMGIAELPLLVFATTAVNVTSCMYVDGLTEEETVVCVSAGLTTTFPAMYVRA